MLKKRINKEKLRGIDLPFDSEVKMLPSLSNITKTLFHDGGYFFKLLKEKRAISSNRY